MVADRYQKARRFIYRRQHFGIKLGLHNIGQLSEWLGNPQDKYHSVHVAGTNGKGSTASFIASILREAGNKVGLLTSPHLADYRERIRVDGKKIGRGDIVRFIEDHKKPILDSEVTFFEVTTALAFWYFEKQKVDWAVLETGLGGRLDATNIIRPAVSVITNISLEHTNLLGRTIYKIAGEKGGIIKKEVPLVTSVINNGNDAARRFKQICHEKNSPIYFTKSGGYQYRLFRGNDYLNIKKGVFAPLNARLGLSGRHQAENGYLAVRTAEVLRSLGYEIPKTAVRRGLAGNGWPGRFMTVKKKPTVIIDVAHNREGFTALAELLRARYPGRKFHFLVSMVEKKKGEMCLRIIAPLAKSISIAPLKTQRSDDPYFLISRLKPELANLRIFPNVTMAARDLLENCYSTDILIIAGSHFIIGELAHILKRNGF